MAAPCSAMSGWEGAVLGGRGISGGGQLLDASEIARRCGVTRGWVYQHAAELGVLRLGGGPRPRLRFDPVVVDGALREGLDARSRRTARRRTRDRNKSVEVVELLPIGSLGRVSSSGVPRSS